MEFKLDFNECPNRHIYILKVTDQIHYLPLIVSCKSPC